MKLLNVNMARAIWLFPFRDLNPKGQPIGQEGLDAIGERYQFQVVPTVAQTVEANRKKEPIVFSTGIIRSKEPVKVAVDLKIYTDGVIAETRSSTRDSEAMLKDLLEWAPPALKLPPVKITIQKKLLVSEIYVRSSKDLTVLNPKLSKFVDMLANSVADASPKSYQLTGLMFTTDPKEGPPLINFRIERQLNTNFEENRYFTAAPMHTEAHLELLKQFERLLSATD